MFVTLAHSIIFNITILIVFQCVAVTLARYKGTKTLQGGLPLVIPDGVYAHSKNSRGFFGGVAVSAIISPLPWQKAPPRQGHMERNCRSHTETDCFAGFAVAIFYEKMLVCSRAGVRVALVSAVICLTVAKSTAAARAYGHATAV